jgi:hypothetical protein
VSTKRRGRKCKKLSTNSLPIEEKLLKQELDESELREVATVLGIDISSVQNGGLCHELVRIFPKLFFVIFFEFFRIYKVIPKLIRFYFHIF